MKQFMKKLLALALVLSVLMSMGITTAQAKDNEPNGRVLTEKDYGTANAIFDLIYSMEETQSTASTSMPQRVYDLVSNMDGVVAGSVEFQGSDRVVWMTEEGVACAYSTRMRNILDAAEPMETDLPDEVVMDFGTRGSHGKDVYVIQPYYGLDTSFTTQYQTEGRRVASVTGGTYYYNKTTAATIDFVASGISNGAVMFFDSHGTTDYENGDDYTSGAKTSYLCLHSGTGITTADYAKDTRLNTYHASYMGASGSGSKRMYIYAVDGTVIANHMTSNSKGGMLWAAICLGMATDGLHAPLMNKGLEVAYGYSQSVTFAGDYCFEEAFFDSLVAGKTASQSIADMKAKYGKWDCSREICAAVGWPSYYAYTTEAAARADYAAFPILVSKEDTYPGHGNVDKVQTPINSTWKLLDETCTHPTTQLQNQQDATCTTAGYTGDRVCTSCGVVVEQGTTIPAKGHTPVLKNAKDPTCTAAGYTGDQVCSVCNTTVKKGSTIPATGHTPVLTNAREATCTTAGYTGDQVCTVCGVTVQRGTTIPAKGHSPVLTNAKEATCTEPGYTGDEICSVCGETVKQGSTIPAKGHTWGEWVTVQAPTTTQNGLEKRTCVDCGAEETRTIPAETCPSAKFTDLDPNAWYHQAVDYMVANGIMSGMDDHTFAPSQPMTRAQFAQILYRLSGSPACNAANPFVDVTNDQWFVKAVIWAADAGVVAGMGNGRFEPQGTVTREQVVTMLFRYAGGKADPVDHLNGFFDGSYVSDWARTAMNWAVGQGYINGSDGRLNPRTAMIRVEVAQLIYKYNQ